MYKYSRGHPHGTYAERGRRGVKPNAYDCVQRGGEFQGCVRTQKYFFWTTKSQNVFFFFFFTKEAITLPFSIVYRKV